MICLDPLQERGGRALLNPGCCGKVFHLDCIINCKKGCPHCRENFDTLTTALGNVSIGHQQPTYQQISVASGAEQLTYQQFSAVPDFAPGLSALSSVFMHPPLIYTNVVYDSASNIPLKKSPSLSETEELISSEVIASPISNSNTAGTLDISVTLLPEFKRTSTNGYDTFHGRAQVKYNGPRVLDNSKGALDMVCIIDNSGSMGDAHFGETKLSYLKKAMNFIVDTMSPNDRLSIVTFNSVAECIHGLRIMNTDEKKLESKTVLQSLVACGGTDILEGLKKGLEILQDRKSANPSSALFLLTDGQDRARLTEKQNSARQLKLNGCAFYVFGFGADHDSQHMMEIAKAGEGSFVYVADDDQIIDAFGGALGAVQGQAIKNVVLTMRSSTCQIFNAFAGDYSTELGHEDGCVAKVTFANIFPNESRDVLVQLRVPTVVNEVKGYPLLQAHVQYNVPYFDRMSTEHQTEEIYCAIDRVQDSNLLATDKLRDIEVDVEVNRLATTEAIQQSLSLADNGNFSLAADVIRAAITKVESSIACEANHISVVAMIEDLQVALANVQRDTYNFGGRAILTETCSTNLYQRQCYSKEGRTPVYQSLSSLNDQMRAKNSKSSFASEETVLY